jgi:hypothetical protein
LQTVMQAVQFARVREIGIVESLNPIVSTWCKRWCKQCFKSNWYCRICIDVNT